MAVLILDPRDAADYVTKRAGTDADRFNEVWEGTFVVPPLSNNEHQEVQFGFAPALHEVVVAAGLGRACLGVNVADRHPDWTTNYRGPDVVVYLAGNPAIDHGTHWEGGPDFLVEIISPGEKPHAKFDFYAAVHTREVLVVNRDPWALELFQLRGGKLALAGRSDVANPVVLASSVLPLTFKLVDAAPRPRIAIAHPPTGRTWEA